MREFPENIKAYKRTEIFTRQSIPTGLLKDHRVAEGVWAKLVVLEGSLTYVIQEPMLERVELMPDRFGVIEPGICHYVIPHEGVRFYVEFYK